MSPGRPVELAAVDGDDVWAAPALAGIQHLTLFPIPRIAVPPPARGARGRGGLRRARWLARETNDAIDALNWFSGHTSPSFRTPTAEQRGAQTRTEGAVHRAWSSFSAHPTPAAAFSELLRGRSVYDMAAARVNVAPFTTLESLSLPSSLDGVPELADALPEEERHYVRGGLEHMLSAPNEFNARDDEAPPCYWDVRLRTSRLTFLQLMRHLVQIGLVRCVPKGRARECCGLFFVKKKNGGAAARDH